MFGILPVTPTSNHSRPESDAMSFETQQGDTISWFGVDESKESYILQSPQGLPRSAQHALYRAQQIRDQTRPGTWFIDVTARPSNIAYDEVEFCAIPYLIGTAVITLGFPEPECKENLAPDSDMVFTDRRRDLLTTIIETTNCDAKEKAEGIESPIVYASAFVEHRPSELAQSNHHSPPTSSSLANPAPPIISSSTDGAPDHMTDDEAYLIQLFQSSGVLQQPHTLAIWLDRMQSDMDYFGQPPYQLWVLDVEFQEPKLERTLPVRRVSYKVESCRAELKKVPIALVYLTACSHAADDRPCESAPQSHSLCKLLPPLPISSLPTDPQTPIYAPTHPPGDLSSPTGLDDYRFGSEYFHPPSPSPTVYSPLKMSCISSSAHPFPATPSSTACSFNGSSMFRVNRSMSVPTGTIGVSMSEPDICAQFAYTTPDLSFSSTKTAPLEWDEEMRKKDGTNWIGPLYAKALREEPFNDLCGLGLDTDGGTFLTPRSPANEIWRSTGSRHGLSVDELISISDDARTAIHFISDAAPGWIGYPAQDAAYRSRSPSIQPEQSLKPGMTYETLHSALDPIVDADDRYAKAQITGDQAWVEITNPMPSFSYDANSETDNSNRPSGTADISEEPYRDIGGTEPNLTDVSRASGKWDNPFGKECIIARKRSYSSFLLEEHRKRLREPTLSNQEDALHYQDLSAVDGSALYPVATTTTTTTHKHKNLPHHPFVIHSPLSSPNIQPTYNYDGDENLDLEPCPFSRRTPLSRSHTELHESNSPVPLGPLTFDDLYEENLLGHFEDYNFNEIGHEGNIGFDECREIESAGSMKSSCAVETRWNCWDPAMNDLDQLKLDRVGSDLTQKKEEEDERNSEETETCEDEGDSEREYDDDDEEEEQEEEEEEKDEEVSEVDEDNAQEANLEAYELQDKNYDKYGAEMEECLVLNNESFESLCAWFGYFHLSPKITIQE